MAARAIHRKRAVGNQSNVRTDASKLVRKTVKVDLNIQFFTNVDFCNPSVKAIRKYLGLVHFQDDDNIESGDVFMFSFFFPPHSSLSPLLPPPPLTIYHFINQFS